MFLYGLLLVGVCALFVCCYVFARCWSLVVVLCEVSVVRCLLCALLLRCLSSYEGRSLFVACCWLMLGVLFVDW